MHQYHQHQPEGPLAKRASSPSPTGRNQVLWGVGFDAALTPFLGSDLQHIEQPSENVGFRCDVAAEENTTSLVFRY